MKKILLTFILATMALVATVAENPLLFVYEESNDNTDPWLEMLRHNLKSRSIDFEEKSASDLEGVDLSSFDRVFFYGAVMGFTLKEPLRSWLDSSPDLTGKKVSLLVTASRWFLEKYTAQLEERLEESGAGKIDAISSVTQNLSDEEKESIAAAAVAAIP